VLADKDSHFKIAADTRKSWQAGEPILLRINARKGKTGTVTHFHGLRCCAQGPQQVRLETGTQGVCAQNLFL